MNTIEFEAFWADAKTVIQDISFAFVSNETEVLEFKDVEVLTDIVPHKVVMHGRYLCRTKEISYTFVVAGIGPIARYDVRGSRHREAGRTHFHRLEEASCPRQNLLRAIARPELSELGALEVWQRLVAEARLTHTGEFFEPEVKC